MDIAEKLNASMASVGRSVKNGADNCKLSAKIAEQQKTIRMLTKEIGNLAVVKLDEGDEMCPEIMERYEAIKEAREAIENLKKERKVTKIPCPSCGAKTSVNMKYCGMCGAKMIEEE